MIRKIINFFKKLFGIKVYKDPLADFKELSNAKHGAEKKDAIRNRLGNGFRKFRNTEPKQKKQKLGLPRFTKPCKMCHDPMYVAKGQIAFTHRDCRTLYRRIYAH